MNHPSIGDNYPLYLQKFWEWMEEHGSKLYEFQTLGGEPMYQKEFEQCINFFDKHPNPNLIWRIFSNLKHDEEKFKKKIQKVT